MKDSLAYVKGVSQHHIVGEHTYMNITKGMSQSYKPLDKSQYKFT